MNDALEQRAHLHLLGLLGHERMHMRHRRRAGLTAADPEARRFELSDDLGTNYEVEGLGCDEDTPWLWMTPWRVRPDDPQPLPLFGRAIFTPAVPEQATRLEAVSGRERFAFDLA